MKTAVLLMLAKAPAGSLTFGYMMGGLIALLILVYLVYSLIKPEKF